MDGLQKAENKMLRNVYLLTSNFLKRSLKFFSVLPKVKKTLFERKGQIPTHTNSYQIIQIPEYLLIQIPDFLKFKSPEHTKTVHKKVNPAGLEQILRKKKHFSIVHEKLIPNFGIIPNQDNLI